MADCKAAPLGSEVFENEAAVAMVGRGFAAEKHGWNGEQGRTEGGFDFALMHEPEKSLLVVLPTAFVFLVGVKHFLGRSEHRFMDIFGAANFAQEILKVFALRETRELRTVVEANVEEAPNVVILQDREESPRRFFRETDGIDFHDEGFAPAKSSD